MPPPPLRPPRPPGRNLVAGASDGIDLDQSDGGESPRRRARRLADEKIRTELTWINAPGERPSHQDPPCWNGNRLPRGVPCRLSSSCPIEIAISSTGPVSGSRTRRGIWSIESTSWSCTASRRARVIRSTRNADGSWPCLPRFPCKPVPDEASHLSMPGQQHECAVVLQAARCFRRTARGGAPRSGRLSGLWRHASLQPQDRQASRHPIAGPSRIPLNARAAGSSVAAPDRDQASRVPPQAAEGRSPVRGPLPMRGTTRTTR